MSEGGAVGVGGLFGGVNRKAQKGERPSEQGSGADAQRAFGHRALVRAEVAARMVMEPDARGGVTVKRIAAHIAARLV